VSEASGAGIAAFSLVLQVGFARAAEWREPDDLSRHFGVDGIRLDHPAPWFFQLL
jgi:hypothetical protein